MCRSSSMKALNVLPPAVLLMLVLLVIPATSWKWVCWDGWNVAGTWYFAVIIRPIIRPIIDIYLPPRCCVTIATWWMMPQQMRTIMPSEDLPCMLIDAPGLLHTCWLIIHACKSPVAHKQALDVMFACKVICMFCKWMILQRSELSELTS